MKRFFTIISVCLGLCSCENLAAQGCFTIRGFGGYGVAGGTGLALVPGVTCMKGKTTYNVHVPIAMYRIHNQSVTDKQIEDASGIARNGDAAFADYLISFGQGHIDTLIFICSLG